MHLDLVRFSTTPIAYFLLVDDRKDPPSGLIAVGLIRQSRGTKHPLLVGERCEKLLVRGPCTWEGRGTVCEG